MAPGCKGKLVSQGSCKRPLLQRGTQRIERGQGAAVGGFEGFDGGDAGGEGLLEGEGGNWKPKSLGSMPFCVELDNLKDTDAPIHQPAAMLVAAD